MKEGDSIEWRTVNGMARGVILKILDGHFLVGLSNGKCVLVSYESATLAI